MLKVDVDRPCHEDWKQFPKSTDGFTLTGHCASCQKDVIDFTNWSETRIKAYFLTKPSNVCGRFRNSQLTEYPLERKPVRTYTSLLSLFLSALLVFSSRLAEAQSRKEKKAEMALYANEDKESKNENRSFNVVGKVVAAEDGESLPGINVVQRGTTNGTITMVDGSFSLDLKNPKETETLIFSFIGLEPVEKEININDGNKLDVQMKADVVMLGGITVGYVGYRTISPRRWWWSLKGLFGRY